MRVRVTPTQSAVPSESVVVVSSETVVGKPLDSEPEAVVDGPAGRAVVRIRTDDCVPNGGVELVDRLRFDLGVDVGDAVDLRPTDVVSAEEVTIAFPGEFGIDDATDVSIRDQLIGRRVLDGQSITITVEGLDLGSSADESLSHRLPVRIVETDPPCPVVIEDWTAVRIASEPATDLEVRNGWRSRSAPTYEDVGGLSEELDRVRELIQVPIRRPEVFSAVGVDPPTGVLLYGPPGTGKTLLAAAVANEGDASVDRVHAGELGSIHPADRKQRLTEFFRAAEERTPAILVVDDVDAITTDSDDGVGTIGHFRSLLDERTDGVAVIGTTNRLGAIPGSIRRSGRFDREIEIGVPDRPQREAILRVHTREMPLGDGVDLATYASNTHGFVGADIEHLVNETAMNALRRAGIGPDTDGSRIAELTVTDADFTAAITTIEPSAMREVRIETPDVTWADVGGLPIAKERLRETVQWPLEHPEPFERVNLDPASGILLYGPPGTGKTLLAKAVANESDANVISVKGPELLNKYVGESEKGVREVFEKARQNAPTVVIFDEIDAIAPERHGTSGTNVGERVVSQLLTELDGLEVLEDVVLIATTNRKDLIDSALVRPGRIEQHVEVEEPNEAARREIFEIHTRDRPAADVDLDSFVARTAGYVGAEIAAVCREAATTAVREYLDPESKATYRSVTDLVLTEKHFERALETVAEDRTGGERE